MPVSNASRLSDVLGVVLLEDWNGAMEALQHSPNLLTMCGMWNMWEQLRERATLNHYGRITPELLSMTQWPHAFTRLQAADIFDSIVTAARKCGVRTNFFNQAEALRE